MHGAGGKRQFWLRSDEGGQASWLKQDSLSGEPQTLTPLPFHAVSVRNRDLNNSAHPLPLPLPWCLQPGLAPFFPGKGDLAAIPSDPLQEPTTNPGSSSVFVWDLSLETAASKPRPTSVTIHCLLHHSSRSLPSLTPTTQTQVLPHPSPWKPRFSPTQTKHASSTLPSIPLRSATTLTSESFLATLHQVLHKAPWFPRNPTPLKHL